MKKIRAHFIVVWSGLSFLGMFLCNFVFTSNYSLLSELSELFFGFHFPICAHSFFMYYAGISDYPMIGLLILLLFIGFIVWWTMAFFNERRNNRMFEHLIITDRILTLIMFGGTAMLLQENFFGKNALICLVIENLIMFSILFILKKRKKTD